MSFDAICFGALNLDRLYGVSKIAGVEEESTVTYFKESGGGSAANTAVGLARLGLRVGYVGKLAYDHEGNFLLDAFRRENVDARGIKILKGGVSGVVSGFVDSEGQRALYVNPGANDSLEFGDINLNYAASGKFLHLTSFVGKRPFEAQKRLVRAVRNMGVKISLDPGNIYARKGLKALLPIIKECFVVLLNERETRLLTGKGYKKGSNRLLESGAKIVAVKLGKRGCYVTDGKDSHLIRSYKAKVVDTTGAGDAFNAGFIYGLIKKKSLYDCGRIGNFVASRCIMEVGARNGLPRRSDLKAMA